MPISIDNVAVFSAGGILGYLVRTFIEHRLAKSRTEEDRKAKEFNVAAVKFRDAFSEVTTKLKNRTAGHTPDGGQIIGESFPRHLAAVDEFRNHIAAQDVPAFNKAWEEYDNDRKYGEYSDRFKNTNPELPHMVALQRIEKLLKFAKPK